MTWLTKIALSKNRRIEHNIKRLESLRSKVHDLGYFVLSSNSGGYQYLKMLLGEKIVLGRPLIKDKLKDALIGENNQKIALDAPLRFKQLMQETEELIKHEINKEKRLLVKT